jgi:hypothetical protein
MVIMTDATATRKAVASKLTKAFLARDIATGGACLPRRLSKASTPSCADGDRRV